MAQTRRDPDFSPRQAADTAFQTGIQSQKRAGACWCLRIVLTLKIDDKIARCLAFCFQKKQTLNLGVDILQGAGMGKEKGLKPRPLDQSQAVSNREGMNTGMQKGIG
jgi:hypothetical protein